MCSSDLGAWQQPPMISKMLGIALQQGDLIRLETPGGGGWGPARLRSALDQARDVKLGYVTSGVLAPQGRKEAV